MPLPRAAKNFLELPLDEIKQFVNSLEVVLTDCDGVLWNNKQPLPGSADVLNKFRDLGKRVFYVTNNSTKTRTELVDKALSLGFKATEDEMLSTGYLTAQYLKENNFTKRAFVLGSTSLSKTLNDFGIDNFGPGPDIIDCPFTDLIDKLTLEAGVGAVVVGFDEHISYPKLLKAASYLKDPQCLFIATNTDEQFPSARGDLIVPGAGTAVRAVETCSGRSPIIIGKPHQYTGDVIVNTFGVDPSKTLMIGDRCNTDILLGTNCNFKTLLVLSGVTSLDDVNQYKLGSVDEQMLVPDFYVPKLGDLLQFLA